MSGRGGKRRQVLQLGSASKLHRYGYSKGFHTMDKKGKGGLPVLVGNYSNSDSEDSEEAEEHTASDMKEEEETLASDTPDISVKTEQPADMDDELKNFLSEIEAIPAAPEIEPSPVPMEDAKSEQEKVVEADLDVQSPGETALDTQKPVSKSKPSSHHYSMFVKGESEFVHSPKLEAEEVTSPAAAREEDLPDEPTTNWQMVKDDNTDYYYYWNTATNEVTWEIPTEYTQYLLLHREYEEKVAKYTPEQLQKLKEKHAKVAGNDSGDADKPTDFHKGLDGRLSKATAKRPQGGLRDTTRSRSVSPRPEVGQDSKHQKHRKDKKSHHKKKHKRRHEDSQSDEDKPSPKVPESKKPAVISTETSTVTILAGGRLTSIVPYLSDQDDSDEDNNLDPMPLLASVALAVTDSQDKDRDGTPTSDKSIDEDPPQLELFSTALQDSQAETAEVSLQVESTQATDSDLSSLALLSPPPPPPPPPKKETLAGKDQTEEDDSELKKTKTHQFDQPLTDAATDLSTYQADIDSDMHMIDSDRHIIDSASPAVESQFNEIIGAILDPVSAKGAADEALSPSVTESTVEAADEALSPSVTESTVEVAQPVKEPVKIRQKEVIDMFAEDFPMPGSTQIKDVAPVDKSGDVVDDHVKKDLVATVEVMEDGETLEKDAHVLLGVEGIGCATSENGSDKKSKTHESSFVKSKSDGNGLEKGSKSSENRVEKRIKTSEKSAEKRVKAQESSLEKREKVQEKILDKKSQPRDNSLEKSRSQTRENSLEKNKVKTSDKDGNRTQENSSQKNRSKTQENSSEKSRGRTQENSSDKSRTKAQENSSEKSRTKTRENSSEKSRSKPQENSPDKNRSKLYENGSDKGRNYTKENSSVKSRHKRENKSEKIRSKLQESSSEKSKKKARENRSEDRINLAEQATLKIVNIVGYASDDEEEEGEVREAVIKKTDKPTHLKQKDKRESKKHRNDSKAPLSSSAAKKLESELVSIVPETLTEVTSEAVAKPVVKPEKVCDDADDDIDFDIDDIDRALEVALEKKLEQKKILLQSMADAGDTISSMTSGAPLPGQMLSTSSGTQIQAPDNGLQTSGEPSSVANSLKKFASAAKVEESAAPEDEQLVVDIRCMAELALSKLEFLDISTDNLSRLQVLFIELQTRFTDWASGGLSTQYFHEQLKTSEHLLEQYELSAVPDGWALQWDRSNNRYYYRNKVTSAIQWEYPEVDSKGDVEAAEPAAENSDESTSRIRERGSEDNHRSRSSGSSRHRRKEDKEKSKYEKHSSSRHYHRKRRRGRDRSSSSNSSSESQQYRRHRKSKKKKRHRAERSLSVEIVEHTDDNLDGVEIIEAPIESTTVVTPQAAVSSPRMVASPASPSAGPIAASTTGHEDKVLDTEGGSATAQHGLDADLDGFPLQAGEEDMVCDQDVPGGDHVDSGAQVETVEVLNPAVISKPPQIVINPQLVAALNPDAHLAAELYSATHIAAPAQASLYPSYHVATPSEQAPPAKEMVNESNEAALEAAKKKKKEKKSLATGSSIMMKKKHMSSMVQKWQKVKIEVEKEDRAKEIRQAAIRQKIEELKNVDKQEK